MLDSLPDFIATYWMYLLGVAVVLAVISYFSEKFFDYLKKGLILFAIVFGLMLGYEMVTGESIFKLPGNVDRKLSEELKNPETGRRYYKSYEERYGKPEE